MSIERLGGAYIPVCDCCGEELATEYDFYDALAAVRAAGWRNVKCGSEWMTYCPDCYNEIHGAAADFTGGGAMNITYLHGEPAPRKELEPFDVVQGSFHAQLYDINSLLDLPLANVRKLWKIMLSAAWENDKSIDQVRGWLPRAAENAAEDIRLAENALKDAKTAAAARHSENAAMGDGYWQKTVTDLKRMLKNAKAKKAPTSVIDNITRNLDSAIQHRDAPRLANRAVKDAQRCLTNCKARQEKVQKLQAIFDDMAAKAKI